MTDEQLDLSRNALCSMVGLPPARKIPTSTATRIAGQNESELRGARDIRKIDACGSGDL